ncbi:MAG: hypothetical protein M1826_003996 [Phylliscum demangeonii]|nr:MAG: hypothetical protein M1826_003996 [Phylliscum demangeonii]
MVRQFDVDAAKERKLEARWKGPRLLVEPTNNESSGYVRDLYGDGVIRRYHVNDIKTYVPRPPLQKTGYGTYTIAPIVCFYDRQAMDQVNFETNR